MALSLHPGLTGHGPSAIVLFMVAPFTSLPSTAPVAVGMTITSTGTRMATPV
jgi:hypothetical protein